MYLNIKRILIISLILVFLFGITTPVTAAGSTQAAITSDGGRTFVGGVGAYLSNNKAFVDNGTLSDPQYVTLSEAIEFVNRQSGTAYEIYIYEDITITSKYILTNSTGVTIKSAPDASKTFTLTADIINNSHTNNRHFQVGTNTDSGILALENIILKGSERGGGVYVRNGQITLKDGAVIADCHSSSVGGGVYMFSNRGSLLIMESGAAITGCSAGTYGGGVYVGDDCQFIMNGGIIQTNQSTKGDGGGIYTTEGGRVKIAAGTEPCYIIGNLALKGDGGGIYTADKTYGNLSTGADTIFNGNQASEVHEPPANANINYLALEFAGISASNHPLNNYDISYTGSSETEIVYTIIYHCNGGQGCFEDIGISSGSYVILSPDFLGITGPDGYTFAGWNSEKDGSGQSYEIGDTVVITANLTIYAKWQKIEKIKEYYAVSYNADGGEGSHSTEVKDGEYYTIEDPADIGITAPDGHIFLNWNSDSKGEGEAYSPGQSIEVNGELTLYAQWGRKSDAKDGYSVNYMTNGGTGSYQDKDIAIGTDYRILTISETGISRSGYRFKSWNTAENGGGQTYASGDIVKIETDLTLYAQWTISGSGDGSGDGNNNNSHDDGKKDDQPVIHPKEHVRYLRGYSDGTVSADHAINRAETAMIFYQLLTDSDKAVYQTIQFSDVSDTQWYAQAVKYLAGVGVLNGYADGTFRPGQPITRAEFVVIISRLEDWEYANTVSFSDINRDHWAYEEICAAYQSGVLRGYPDSTFKPDMSITRAEVVTIVNKLFDRAIDDEALAHVVNPYSDINTNHWAYAEIIEASIEHQYVRDDNGMEIWQ